MDLTDFGQIEIFEDYFPDINSNDIEFSPTECINLGKTYSVIYHGSEIPIMVGSKYSTDNPLSVVGYFIIDGLCYSMNNMFIKIKNNFRDKTAFLIDGSKIMIKNMFEYYKYDKGKTKSWNIPINWIEIANKDEVLYNHLKIISKFNKIPLTPSIKNIYDIEALRFMFKLWLGLIEEPDYNFRLITPGEIIYDMYKNKKNIIDSFKINKWNVKYMLNVTSVSEPMKHYNIYSDIESIRRVTFPTERENMKLEDRQVKLNEKNKLCPVQSPDGQLCGTVKYLVKDAKLTEDQKLPKHFDEGDIRIILNGKFIGSVDSLKYFKNCDIIKFENYAYISSLKGRIINGSLLSYSASKIPHIFHNPPVRATFVTSMIKQSIEFNLKYLNNINDTKFLTKNLKHQFNVAIMPWFGFNIEDSIVISKSVAEHFNYTKQVIYRENNKRILDIYVKEGDIVNKETILYRTYDFTQIKTLENVYAKSEGEVVKIIKDPFKIIIHKKNNLQVGDKMTSLHGQKGVISLILDNPPYYIKNNKKIYIDIIINPHAFPSRMTMGQIKELNENYENVYIENKMIKNKILVNKCVYLALRHQVEDKIQHCNNDSFDFITKQSKEGKKNNGGLRFGQMERDILFAIEAKNTIKEIWNIDKIKIPICEKTGKFFPKCCNKLIDSNQYFLICLTYIRVLGFDILLKLKENKYSIVKFDSKHLPISKDKYFGSDDPSDIRIYRGVVTAPNCLRNPLINYILSQPNIKNEVLKKEYKNLLINKNGAFHKYFEGHRSNHCFRSVISPDPTLPLDVVKIPYGINIGTNYCILNRQPTLNISSMRFMKIEYKKEKTISFNPLLCKSFNADFDGDEMNLYGIINEKSIEELKVLKKEPNDVQDYILMKYLNLKSLEELTYFGITFNKKDVEKMIKSGSKGKDFNYKHMFEKIGEVTYNNKKYIINDCYNDGLKKEEWYILSMVTRNNTASIALNTPISGYLQAITNQLILGKTD